MGTVHGVAESDTTEWLTHTHTHTHTLLSVDLIPDELSEQWPLEGL